MHQVVECFLHEVGATLQQQISPHLLQLELLKKVLLLQGLTKLRVLFEMFERFLVEGNSIEEIILHFGLNLLLYRFDIIEQSQDQQGFLGEIWNKLTIIFFLQVHEIPDADLGE